MLWKNSALKTSSLEPVKVKRALSVNHVVSDRAEALAKVAEIAAHVVMAHVVAHEAVAVETAADPEAVAAMEDMLP